MNKIEIYSPVDNSYIASVEAMSQEKIDEKIKRLDKEFKSFKELSVTKRAKYIIEAADELEKHVKELAKILCMEISKSYKDCVNEIERSVEMMKYTANEGIRIETLAYNGDSYGSKDKIALVTREALGVILCISPFNYPINLSISKIAPALISGNTVLLKPPTQGSYTCTKMVEILNKVLPENVLEIATGYGRVIGDYMNTHPLVQFINFTGSTEIGKDIASKVSFKGLLMELGGKDAAIVLDDANLEKTAKDIVQGAFNYSGQRCTAIKRVLVDSKIKNDLIKLILEKVSKLSVGSPMDNADITPVISLKSAEYIQELIDDAKNKGAKILIGDKREKNLIYPCVIDNVSLDMRVAFEEPFGPVLPIISFDDVKDAIKIANMSGYGLQSSVFTENFKKAMHIAKQLEVGTVHINNKTQRGPDNFPFLGIKDSGIGVQGIKDSIISMTRIKSIVFDI